MGGSYEYDSEIKIKTIKYGDNYWILSRYISRIYSEGSRHITVHYTAWIITVKYNC